MDKLGLQVSVLKRSSQLASLIPQGRNEILLKPGEIQEIWEVQEIQGFSLSFNISRIYSIVKLPHRLYKFHMQQESIYNLVPKEYAPPPKEAKYRSKYPPNLPPTGSTFCHKTTSKPGVANLAGKLAQEPGAHTNYGETKTMGHLKGQRKPSPDKFRLKNTGTMGDNKLPEPQKYQYDCSHKKDPVPKATQKPVMGLKSGKNFVVTNAVQNILSVPKAPKQQIQYVNKKDFGKVPQYLDKIKTNIQNEYQMIQHIRSDAPENYYSLSQEQAQQLREGLKKKWEQVNKEYQSITHISKIDTIGLKRKKESCEKQLSQIEKDIKKLNKLYVFVDAR